MLHKKSRLLPFSNTALPTSLKWRTVLQQRRLAAQIAALLLHRKNWIPLLRRSNPPLITRHPTPDLILNILTRTQSHPDISLRFFHWAQSTLAFQPDLRSLCKIAHILIDSDLLSAAKQFLDPVLRSQPAPTVLDSILRSAPAKDSQAKALSFILESYSDQRSTNNALETFRRIRILGCQPSTHCCNALLDALCSCNETQTALRVYAAVLRAGMTPDSRSWTLLARLLCNEGKLDRAVLLLDLGFCGEIKTYDLAIDCYCRSGDFGAAVRLLNKMYERNLNPSFGTYSLILDGGCRSGDAKVVDLILREMTTKGLLLSMDYDRVITHLCELQKTYAAEMFFHRARSESFGLAKSSYGSMMRAFSMGGRVDEAMELYEIMVREDISVDSNCYGVLLSGLCKGEPSKRANRMLKDAIAGLFCLPSATDLSKYIASQCSKGWWREAGDLLDVAMEKGVLPEASCCDALVEHYCGDGLVDSAILLYDRMKKLGGCLELASCNSLLEALVGERRIEEAIKVFDYMRERDVLSSASFVIMIPALCHENELRKAMKLHDEMLNLGFKPGETTYKHLISGFG